MPEPLILVGAGGFARETAEAVAAINDIEPTWHLLGYLDDDTTLHGTPVGRYPVLGPISALAQYPDARIVVCTGRPGNHFSKKAIVRKLDLPSERYATIVHPSASIGSSCEISPGTVVLAYTVATADVSIGAHVGVMPHVTLTHDDVLSDFVIVGAGTGLAGSVQVGEGAYVGAGALIRENRWIGPWALIGMGAVVLDDVPAGQVWVGVPARYLRGIDIPKEVQP